MSIRDEIVNFIRENRVSTTEVADALGKSGVLHGVLPITPDFHRVGPARALFTANNSNYALHEQIRHLERGEVAVVFAHDCAERALIGDLMAKYILLYRGASALVVNGLVRDASRLRRERYAVWAEGVTPMGCFNSPASPFPAELEKSWREKIEGGVAVCDDGGVVVIPPSSLDEHMLARLRRMEMQEDIWYFCLDTLKWDTKMIVCDREYLKQPDLLPSAHRKLLGELQRPFDKQ
jgi:4-hydroxy-4-methyl-2-oxoglutarate aldolase